LTAARTVGTATVSVKSNKCFLCVFESGHNKALNDCSLGKQGNITHCFLWDQSLKRLLATRFLDCFQMRECIILARVILYPNQIIWSFSYNSLHLQLLTQNADKNVLGDWLR